MKATPRTHTSGRSRTIALAVFLLMQSVAAMFFLADAMRDLSEMPLGGHSVLEALISLVLVLGIFLTGWHLRLTLQEMETQRRALDTARGDLLRVVETQFDVWHLTSAEKDVGLLALKGIDVADIATIRGAAQGTVRAQMARIYAKAGVSGRAQFAAWFVEDLLTLEAEPEK